MAVAVGKMDQSYADGRSNSKSVPIDSEGNVTDLNSDDSQIRDGRKGGRPPPLEVRKPPLPVCILDERYKICVISLQMTTINNSAGGPKTPTPGPSTAASATGTSKVTVARSKSEREKKIGHRRVTEGGDVTYKKIQTSQIMGSIQLGIQHAIGGLASKPERDLLMQVGSLLATIYYNCVINFSSH